MDFEGRIARVGRIFAQPLHASTGIHIHIHTYIRKQRFAYGTVKQLFKSSRSVLQLLIADNFVPPDD
jgi:hypothetical protein